MEELIEAVRSEKCLYDVKHQDYMNTKLKDSIWKRIADALNLKDGSEAKKSWEKLRNNHRDALRRQKISKPKSAVNIKAWRFQENMAFLIPHMANRPSNSNVNEDIPNDESSHSNSNTIENDIQKNVDDTDIHESGVEEINETPESQSTGTAADQGNKKRRKKNTLNNLLTKSIEDHERRAAKRQLERERLIANTNNDFTISNVKNDPLFHFFISMYETTKRLPPLTQHNIKTNIFSLVSQEESKTLVEYSPRPHSSYSQNSDVKYYSSYTPSPAEQKPHSDGIYYTTTPIQQQPQEGGTQNIITTQGMLEVCIDSLESAINAVNGGAEELEVCSSLAEGGLTPSPGLVQQILSMVVESSMHNNPKSNLKPKVNVMLRCRPGSDFHYSDTEMKTMLADLTFFKDMGVDRFVFGALTSTQEVDKKNCAKIIANAYPVPVTFHRAFDVCNDPVTGLEKIIDLGFNRVLTSGQRPSVGHVDAVKLIESLIEKYGHNIEIMPGAGINQENVKIYVEMGCKIVHSSCKSVRQLLAIENNLAMGAERTECISYTDENNVKRLKDVMGGVVKK